MYRKILEAQSAEYSVYGTYQVHYVLPMYLYGLVRHFLGRIIYASGYFQF